MITNLINDRGNAVKNQFIITEGNTTAFQSYNSRICEIVRPCGMGFDALVRFERDEVECTVGAFLDLLEMEETI